MVSKSIINDVISTGAPVLTTNALEDQRYQQQQSIVGFALRSILAVPLKVRGDIIGIVYCDNRVLAGLFAQRELELVSSFADHAASAIDNARLFQEIRAQLAEVSALRDLLDRIFDSIAAGVITLDAEGTITLANHAATVMFKADGPLTGRKLSGVFVEMPGTLLSAMTYVRASARPMPFDTSVVIPGRGECYMNIVMSPVANGQGLALVIDDLTAEKRHEAQITEVVRYLPTALVKNLASVAEVDVRGQERDITAMFCDVRGFTSFSETLDPGDSMRVINQYLSLASDAINLYEGIVDKYMGDAVTGLFNTQLNPQEDHAVRAVSAGLSMLAELKALHDILPEDHRLLYGIGIDSGLAVLGNVGGVERKEFTALGEPTEISKILQENARGEVVISESTYQKVKDTFECVPHALEKTSDRPDLSAYKVIRRKSGLTSTYLLIDKELADLLKDTSS
jgi:class 3 adenylate cyclase/PAS domain-containing protein